MNTFDELVESYVKLGLAVDEHEAGYVDSYYGPGAWREAAKAAGARPLAQLEKEAQALLEATIASTGQDTRRQDYLVKELRALHMRLRGMLGEKIGFVEETEALFDVTPAFVSEERFDEAHRLMEDVLPGEGSLAERVAAWKKSTELHLDVNDPNIGWLMGELRRRTSELFPLPQDEAFELTLVSDKPWRAYNVYQGGYYSRIDINTDLPVNLFWLPDMLAHEGYPGHHTELSIKESLLTKGQGWQEYCIALTYGPSSVIAEGIATRALDILLPGDARQDWMADELYPRFGIDPAFARRDQMIARARRNLDLVAGNAAFMLFERAENDADILAYLQRYLKNSDEEVRHTLNFLKHNGSYIFTYSMGGDLLDALFAARGEPVAWFKRLLTEPVTPGRVRAWIAGENGI